MRSPRPATIAALVLLAGCGPSDASSGSGERPGTDGSGPAGTVLVSAAASLTDAFADMAAAFESAHPGLEVTLNLAGSSTLRAQILEGAPADVFASAHRTHMDRLAEAGEVAGEPRVFARNLLRIAVPTGNPAGVTGLDDLARDELLVGLCAEQVPCGALAREALARAGVTPSVDTGEPDVRALLTRIALGELDAGIVYASDVASARGAVEGVAIPAGRNVVAEYPIAVLARAPHPEGARAFVEYVLSAAGRAVLARHGFTAP